MNIKSEINKINNDFINVPILIAIISSFILSLLIISSNAAYIFKLGFVIIGISLTLILTYDHIEKSKRINEFKQNISIIVMTLVFTELVLGFQAQQTYRIEIDIITTPKTETINYVVKGKVTPTVRPYTLVEYYSNENNNRIGSKKVQDEKKLKLYTNIVARETYYEYFPFFIYEQKTKFVKGTK